VFADPEIPGSKQPFHAAEPMPIVKAEAFLKRCTQSTQLLAIDALRDCIAKLKNDGHEVCACGLLSAAGRVPDSLAAILASHAAIHAAEGEFYRAAVAHACYVLNLPLARVREKEVMDIAAQAIGVTPAAITNKIAALGKQIGPPWSADQKLAALAAWVALVRTDRKAAAV